MPLIPGVNDSADNLKQLADFLTTVGQPYFFLPAPYALCDWTHIWQAHSPAYLTKELRRNGPYVVEESIFSCAAWGLG
jgi:hypothetical protein